MGRSDVLRDGVIAIGVYVDQNAFGRAGNFAVDGGGEAAGVDATGAGGAEELRTQIVAQTEPATATRATTATATAAILADDIMVMAPLTIVEVEAARLNRRGRWRRLWRWR